MQPTRLEHAAAAVAEHLLEIRSVQGVHLAPIPGSHRADFYGPTHRIIAIVDDERFFQYLEDIESPDFTLPEAALRALGQQSRDINDARAFIERIIRSRTSLSHDDIQDAVDAFELVPLRSRWRNDVDRLDQSTRYLRSVQARLPIFVDYPGQPAAWRHAAQYYRVYVPMVGQFVSH